MNAIKYLYEEYESNNNSYSVKYMLSNERGYRSYRYEDTLYFNSFEDIKNFFEEKFGEGRWRLSSYDGVQYQYDNKRKNVYVDYIYPPGVDFNNGFVPTSAKKTYNEFIKYIELENNKNNLYNFDDMYRNSLNKLQKGNYKDIL